MTTLGQEAMMTTLGPVEETIIEGEVEVRVASVKAPEGHRFLRDTWLATWVCAGGRQGHVYAETKKLAQDSALSAARSVTYQKEGA